MEKDGENDQKELSFVCQGWTFKGMMGVEWVPGVITLLIGVIAPYITGTLNGADGVWKSYRMRFWEGLQQVKLSQKLPHLEEDVLSPGNQR